MLDYLLLHLAPYIFWLRVAAACIVFCGMSFAVFFAMSKAPFVKKAKFRYRLLIAVVAGALFALLIWFFQMGGGGGGDDDQNKIPEKVIPIDHNIELVFDFANGTVRYTEGGVDGEVIAMDRSKIREALVGTRKNNPNTATRFRVTVINCDLIWQNRVQKLYDDVFDKSIRAADDIDIKTGYETPQSEK